MTLKQATLSELSCFDYSSTTSPSLLVPDFYDLLLKEKGRTHYCFQRLVSCSRQPFPFYIHTFTLILFFPNLSFALIPPFY